MRNLASRLKEVRKDRGLSQEAFAKSMGIAKRTYIYWEHGDHAPQVSLFRGLSRLGVSILWLTTGEGDMYSMLPSEKEELITRAQHFESANKHAESELWMIRSRLLKRLPEEEVNKLFEGPTSFKDTDVVSYPNPDLGVGEDTNIAIADRHKRGGR